MRTNVYIDGFNVYYGCFKGDPQYRPYKWLDLRGLSAALVPNDHIHRVHYFTAMVAGTPWDPDQPLRQETYIRALRTLPLLYVHLGKFQQVVRKGLPVNPGTGPGQVPQRYQTWEEKGSDVNIATRLLMDAVDDDFEQALLISNDSDLMEPVRLVKQRFKKSIIVVSPYPTVTTKLRRSASSWQVLDKSLLAQHQLPAAIIDKHGRRITKPATW